MVRALHGRTGILCTVVLLGFAWSANASVITTPDYITDNFDTGTNDLWTVVTGSNASLTWSNAVPPGNSPLGSPAPGGVNPGYLDVSDKQNKPMVVQAPTAFSGDLSRFVNSTLFFDGFVKQISGGPGTQPQQSFGVVVITGTGAASGLQASIDLGTLNSTATGYARLSAVLNGNWISGADPHAVGGTAIGSTNFLTLMTNVSNITVDLSLRQSSSDDVAFDNFTIGTPEPSTIGLALVGLAGLGLARKRIKK